MPVKKNCRITHGNKALKSTLTESAWAASRTKGTYLKAKYHSLIGRRGKKRALIAVGHKILIIVYHILKFKVEYKELGMDYLDKMREERIIRSYKKRLQNLGYEAILLKRAQ